MIKATYDQLVERISKLAGLELKEIERRVEAKRARLSGLISKEGAAQVVAAELGISFDKQKYKISDLLTGMKKVQVTGKVINIFPVRTFLRGGIESKVANLVIADETSNIKTVFWDTHHIAKIESGEIKPGTVIDIKNADVRGTGNKELHLGSNSELTISDKQITKVITTPQNLELKKISEINLNENTRVKGAIMQVFQPRFFNVCPECNSKVSFEQGQYTCGRHGNVMPKERALINIVIDDGSNNINAIAFNEIAEKIFNSPMENLKDPLSFMEKKQELLAKEFFFSGRARKNMLFNKDEFVIQDMNEVLPEQLIEQLQK